jgi:choline dehydrogenase-like flavoprotein
MDYTVNSYDANSLVRGTIAAAEIHLVNGAKRITTAIVDVDDYIPAPGHQYLADPKWKEWVAKIEKAGVYPSRCAIGSAHQMGSCQMGSKPSTSVVDPRGRVWGTDGLYVADASVFPTASGVNPMITVRGVASLARLNLVLTSGWLSQNMSLSHSIARFIDEDARESYTQPVEAHL